MDDGTCGATGVFWPEEECISVICVLPRGHLPEDIHEDEMLGRWSEDDVPTAEAL